MEPKEKETVLPNVIVLAIRLHLDVPFTSIFVAFVQIAWSSRETFRIAGTVLAFYYSGKLPSLYAIYACVYLLSLCLGTFSLAVYSAPCVQHLKNGSHEEVLRHGEGRTHGGSGAEGRRREPGSLRGTVQAWSGQGGESP